MMFKYVLFDDFDSMLLSSLNNFCGTKPAYLCSAKIVHHFGI